jgi:hypothetical protein
MASENAGAIYVEIRAALDKLQVDINKSESMFNQIQDKAKPATETTTRMFEKMGKNIGKNIIDLSNNSVGQFAKMMKGIKKAIVAAPVVGAILMIIGTIKKLFSSVADYVNRTSEAYTNQQKALNTLNSVLKSTGAVAWTTSVQLEKTADNLSKTTGVATNSIIEMQTRLLTYNNITGDIFERTQKAAFDMAAVMGMDVTSAAETLGKALDSPIEGLTALTRQGFRFKGELKEQIQLLVSQGQIAKAQALILKEVETAYGGAAAAQADALGIGQKLQNAQEKLNAELGKSTSVLKGFFQNIKLSYVEARLAAVSFSNVEKEVAKSDKKIKELSLSIEELKKRYKEFGDEAYLEEIEKQTKEKFETEIKAASAKLQVITKEYQKILNEYRIAQINENGTRENQEYIKELKETADNLRLQKITQEQLLKIQQQQQAVAAGNTNLTKQEYADNAAVKKLTEQMLEIQQKRQKTIQEAQSDLRNERIDQEQYEKKINSAYAEEANQLTAIKVALQNITMTTAEGAEYQKTSIDMVVKALQEATKEELHQRDILKQIEDDEKRRAAGESATKQFIDQEKQYHLELAIREGNLEKIKEIETEIHDEQIKQSDTYRDLLAGLQEGTTEYEEALKIQRDLLFISQQTREMQADTAIQKSIDDMNFKTLQAKAKEKGAVEEIQKAEKERALAQLMNTKDFQNASEEMKKKIIEAFNELWDVTNKKNPLDKLENYVQKYGAAVSGVISNFANLYASAIQKQVDEEIKALDKLYNVQLEYLEKEKQAKLYAKGYIEAQTEEQHQRELELAIESGDQQRIYAAQDAYEKWKIEEEFAQSKKALDEDTARQKSQLEYKVALAQWRSQLLQAIVSASMATLGTLASPPYPPYNLPLVALSAALGAAQVGIVSTNKPKLQSFADGGIVSGNSFRGDNMLVRANSDEMFLTRQHQKNLFDRIDNNDLGDSEKVITINVPVNIDGREVTRIVATYINNRVELIKEGSIVK